MGLWGTLDTMPIDELMQWLAFANRAGKLLVKYSAVTKIVVLESGMVIKAASTDPREYLGQFLLNFGLITEDQLQKAFETQQETHVLLGKILTMTGICSEDQIQRMLTLKIRESIMDLMLILEGSFEFQDGSQPTDTSIVPIAVELNAIVKEGLERRAHYQQIRRIIPTNAHRFETQKLLIPADLDRQSTDALMLEQVRQGLSVADIVLKFHSLDYPILRRMFDLVQRGWLKVIEPSPVAGPADNIPDVDIEIDSEFEKSVHPQTDEQALLESLRGELLVDKSVPVLLKADIVRSDSRLTPAQRYLLGRIDGTRSLRTIIMVSPLKEIDALTAFRSLIKNGAVALQ
jgi:hypothetical protein